MYSAVPKGVGEGVGEGYKEVLRRGISAGNRTPKTKRKTPQKIPKREPINTKKTGVKFSPHDITVQSDEVRTSPTSERKSRLKSPPSHKRNTSLTGNKPTHRVVDNFSGLRTLPVGATSQSALSNINNPPHVVVRDDFYEKQSTPTREARKLKTKTQHSKSSDYDMLSTTTIGNNCYELVTNRNQNNKLMSSAVSTIRSSPYRHNDDSLKDSNDVRKPHRQQRKTIEDPRDQLTPTASEKSLYNVRRQQRQQRTVERSEDEFIAIDEDPQQLRSTSASTATAMAVGSERPSAIMIGDDLYDIRKPANRKSFSQQRNDNEFTISEADTPTATTMTTATTTERRPSTVTFGDDLYDIRKTPTVVRNDYRDMIPTPRRSEKPSTVVIDNNYYDLRQPPPSAVRRSESLIEDDHYDTRGTPARKLHFHQRNIDEFAAIQSDPQQQYINTLTPSTVAFGDDLYDMRKTPTVVRNDYRDMIPTPRRSEKPSTVVIDNNYYDLRQPPPSAVRRSAASRRSSREDVFEMSDEECVDIVQFVLSDNQIMFEEQFSDEECVYLVHKAACCLPSNTIISNNELLHLLTTELKYHLRRYTNRHPHPQRKITFSDVEDEVNRQKQRRRISFKESSLRTSSNDNINKQLFDRNTNSGYRYTPRKVAPRPHQLSSPQESNRYPQKRLSHNDEMFDKEVLDPMDPVSTSGFIKLNRNNNQTCNSPVGVDDRETPFRRKPMTDSHSRDIYERKKPKSDDFIDSPIRSKEYFETSISEIYRRKPVRDNHRQQHSSRNRSDHQFDNDKYNSRDVYERRKPTTRTHSDDFIDIPIRSRDLNTGEVRHSNKHSDGMTEFDHRTHLYEGKHPTRGIELDDYHQTGESQTQLYCTIVSEGSTRREVELKLPHPPPWKLRDISSYLSLAGVTPPDDKCPDSVIFCVERMSVRTVVDTPDMNILFGDRLFIIILLPYDGFVSNVQRIDTRKLWKQHNRSFI